MSIETLNNGESMGTIRDKINDNFAQVQPTILATGVLSGDGSGNIISATQSEMYESLDLLSSATAGALGLDGTATVNDAINKIANKAVRTDLHVWDKFSYSDALTEYATIVVSSGSTALTGSNVYYADTYTYDPISDTYSLVSPSSISLTYNDYATYETTLRGKYWFVSDDNAGSSTSKRSNFYKGSDSGSLTRAIVSDVYYTYFPSATIAGRDYIGQVVSVNENEYTTGQIIDGYIYSYLGHPQYIGTQIITGSYVGTGTVGLGGACELNFNFRPFLVFVSRRAYISTYFQLMLIRPAIYANSIAMASTVGAAITAQWGANGVLWYDSDRNGESERQLNESGYIYDYIAIGG